MPGCKIYALKGKKGKKKRKEKEKGGKNGDQYRVHVFSYAVFHFWNFFLDHLSFFTSRSPV